MKKTVLSLVAMIGLSSAVMAETYDAYGSGSYENSHKIDSSVTDYRGTVPYVGIAYTYLSGGIDISATGLTASADIDANMGVTVKAGMDFNQYVGAEVRYMSTINDSSLEAGGQKIYTNKKVRNIGAYLKPQYKNELGSFYGLLGYGRVQFADIKENQFQWGLGFSYSFENNIDIYADFLRIYDEADSLIDNANVISADMTVDTYSIGISYRF